MPKVKKLPSQLNTMISHLETTQLKARINTLIANAIGGDVLSEEGGGFLTVMAKGNPDIRKDIPVAFEMYTLLSHFLSRLPVMEAAIGDDLTILSLTPSILHDDSRGKIVALVPIGRGDFSDVAYWLADGLPSPHVKNMDGLLALCFSIEEHDGVKHLLPEWFAAFYVNGKANHCVPLLGLRSILTNPQFGGDWVDVALKRMVAFGLPNTDAMAAAATVKPAMA